MNSNLEKFLEFFSKHESVALAEVAETLSPESETAAGALVEGLSDVFCALGVLQKKGRRLCPSDDATKSVLVLHSLLEFVKERRPVLADFKKSGPQEVWVSVLYEVEKRRTSFSNQHIRRAFVGQAIIVGSSEETRYVLFDYDAIWKQYKFPGGKANEHGSSTLEQEARENAWQAIKRELAEELQHDIGHVFVLRDKSVHEFQLTTISRTHGAVTLYDFLLCGVNPSGARHLDYSGERGAHLTWISLDELRTLADQNPTMFIDGSLCDKVFEYIEKEAVPYCMNEKDKERVFRRHEVRPVEPNGRSLRRHPAFGLWRDRMDLANAADASLALRKQAERRVPGG